MAEVGVSVVMCTYNGAAYLSAQLDSILQQTLPATEIVVQDDGSTDETWAILTDYATRYPQIRLYRNEGTHGINANFFSAMRRASCALIAIADQDDLWQPRKLEQQVAAMSGEVWLVGGMSMPFSENEAIAVDYDQRRPNLSLLRMLYVGMMPGHTQLIRREMLAYLPLTDFFMYDLQTQVLAAAAGRIAHLPDVLVKQRRHSAAATYQQPRNRQRTLGNGLQSVWEALRLYPRLRPHLKHRFEQWRPILAGLPFTTKQLQDARELCRLHTTDGCWAYLRLTLFCLKHRHELCHTAERKEMAAIARALVHPFMIATQYRYLLKQ